FQYTLSPAAKACTNTTTNGITTTNVMTVTAAPIRSRRTIGGSSWARRGVLAALAMVAGTPAFEEVDGEQGDERDREQDDGDGGCLGVAELLETGDDEHRRDLGPERHVARDEDHRAVLAERAGEREGEPRDDRGRDRGQDDLDRSLEAVRPQARRGLLDVALEALEDGLQRAHHEREADEDEDEHDARARVRDLDAEGPQEGSVPPALHEQTRIHEPRHRGGQGEGEIHQRVEEALQREVVAHQHPGDEHADDDVDQGGREGGAQGEEV